MLVPVAVRQPAEAALIEIAQAARQAQPVDVPDGSFIYAESTGFNLVGREGDEFGLPGGSVAYLIPEFEDFWAFSGGREAVTWGFGFRLRVRERFCRDNSPCTLGVEPR